MRRTALLGCLLLSACGPDDGTGDGELKPVYAVESLTWGLFGPFSYITLIDHLDAQPTVTFAGAREFGGYSPADPYEGDIIVGSGEAPTLKRFSISGNKRWTERKTISFANFTTQPLVASLYASPTKAFVPFDTVNFVTWDPVSFTLGAEVGASPDVPLKRDGLIVNKGYAYEFRGQELFQAYYWSTEGFERYSETSTVSIIDTETATVKGSFDAPCPHFHVSSNDGAGTLWFSNSQGSIPAAVLDPAQPRNCFVKVKAGESTPSAPTYFKDLTDGREGSSIFYIGDGKALFNVFHHEREDMTKATRATLDMSPNYRLWLLDLDTLHAEPMPGIDFSGGQISAYRIDDRVYAAMPAPDYSTTTIYEILPTGAEKRFDVQGWGFKLFRVR